MFHWLVQHGCPCDEGTWRSMADKFENRCPGTVMTCTEAAEGGNLEMLQWARQYGCPWDAKTCSAAAGGGHLEILQWAHQNGCPWNVETCSAAAEHVYSFHGHPF